MEDEYVAVAGEHYHLTTDDGSYKHKGMVTSVMDELIAGDTVFNEKISGNFKDKQNYFAELAENAKSIDFKGLITPYDATIKGNFADAVKENYLEGGKDWDATVEAFKDKVAESVPDLKID